MISASTSTFLLHQQALQRNQQDEQDDDSADDLARNTLDLRQKQATQNAQRNSRNLDMVDPENLQDGPETRDDHLQLLDLPAPGVARNGQENNPNAVVHPRTASGANNRQSATVSTPSMRRADLVSVGRSHAHQNLVQNTEFTMCYESVILLYLTCCIYLLQVGSQFNKSCSLDPRLHTMHFVMFIMWPTVFIRLLVYVKYRNANYVSMQNCLFFLNAFYNVSYGFWTIYNIMKILDLPHDAACKSNGTNVLELNYEVVIIFGVFPALVTSFFLTMGVLCAPYIFYIIYQNRQHENYQLNMSKRMVSALFRVKYDANVFQTQDSCMICLVDFDEDSQVTPLPCDIRHYFHTSCIEQWLMINASCPLCKTPVTIEEIDRVAQMYQRKLNQHEKCCSEASFKESAYNIENNHKRTVSYKSVVTESKDCSSHYNVNSQFYNQTFDSGMSSHTYEDAPTRMTRELEMTIQPRRTSKINLMYTGDSRQPVEVQRTASSGTPDPTRMPIRRQKTNPMSVQ